VCPYCAWDLCLADLCPNAFLLSKDEARPRTGDSLLGGPLKPGWNEFRLCSAPGTCCFTSRAPWESASTVWRRHAARLPWVAPQILCYLRLPLQAIGDELHHTFRQKQSPFPHRQGTTIREMAGLSSGKASSLGSEWFTGSGATGSISPARDRLIGVALGILLMWFVFDQIWPCAPVKLSERAASHPHDAGRNSTVQQARKARP
jgi:hypothetical protein